MTDQPRKRITIDAPNGPTTLAARHLDPTEGRVQVGTTVDPATRAAITHVLDYVAKAHNSLAAPALPASTAPAAAAHPLVQGRCPVCRGASLFLGSGGHVTCARLDCPDPCAADKLLHGEQSAPDPAATEATEADAWTQQKDGTWTMPIDGGTILFTRRSTPEERARFTAAWARQQKAAQCEDCLAGAHGPNAHRKQSPPLEPQIIPAGLPPWIRNSLHDLNVRERPAEHCGHQSPVTLLTAQPTECVLQPGHQGSHADDRGCRWWPTPEAVDWRQRAETAETALEHVLHVADLIEAGAPWTANRADTARRIRDAAGIGGHDDGPSVQECAEADRKWDLQKGGE